jgi:hypothetical protein
VGSKGEERKEATTALLLLNADVQLSALGKDKMCKCGFAGANQIKIVVNDTAAAGEVNDWGQKGDRRVNERTMDMEEGGKIDEKWGEIDKEGKGICKSNYINAKKPDTIKVCRFLLIGIIQREQYEEEWASFLHKRFSESQTFFSYVKFKNIRCS